MENTLERLTFGDKNKCLEFVEELSNIILSKIGSDIPKEACIVQARNMLRWCQVNFEKAKTDTLEKMADTIIEVWNM